MYNLENYQVSTTKGTGCVYFHKITPFYYIINKKLSLGRGDIIILEEVRV